MAKKCTIIYKQGFNETKKYLYNNYISVLFNDEIIKQNEQGRFVSLGSPLSFKDSEILFNLVEGKLTDIVKDKVSKSIDLDEIESNIEDRLPGLSDENFHKAVLQEIKNYYTTTEFTKAKQKSVKQQLDLIYILESFEDFKNYNKAQSKIKISEKEDEDSVESNSEVLETTRFKDTISTSAWDRGDLNLKNLFINVPKLNKDGSYKINLRTGLPVMIDGISLFNNLTNELAGTLDYKTFWTKINSKEFKDKFPEIVHVLKFLPDSTKSYSNLNPITAVQLKTAFYQTFNKTVIPLMGYTISTNGNSYKKPFLANRDTIIKGKWNNNFRDQRESEYVKSDKGLRVLVKVPAIEEQTPKFYKKFLKVLGIGLADILYTPKYISEVTLALTGNQGLETSIKKYLDYLKSKGEVKGVDNFILHFYEDYSKKDKTEQQFLRNIGNKIKDLIELESKFSNLQLVLTHRNPKGDLQSAVSERNSFSLLITQINAAKNIEELYKNLPQLKNNIQFQPGSYWYDKLFDATGKKRKNNSLILNNYTGFQDEIRPSNSRNTAEMNKKEKLFFDLNMLREDIIDLPRTSTSDTYYSVVQESKTDLTTEKRETQFLNYLKRELEAIQNGKIKEFYIFDTILPTEYKNTLLKLISNKDRSIREVISTNRQSILEHINNFFNKETQTISSLIDYYNIDYNSLKLNKTIYKNKEGVEVKVDTSIPYELFEAEKNYDKQELLDTNKLKMLMFKHFINSVEATYLFTGNPSNFKDFTKRFKGNLSTGLPMDENGDVEILLNDIRLGANIYSIGNQMNGEIGSITRRNNSKTFLTKTFYDSLDKGKKIFNRLLNIKNRDNSLTKDQVDDFKKVLKAYEEINVADGQAWLNLDFYREFLMRTGNWSNEKELTVELEGLIFKSKILNKELTKAEEDRFKYLQNLVENDDRYILPPVKGQYNGMYANNENPELSFDKMSLAPVLPSVIVATNNKELEKLIKNMGLYSTGYVKYESVSKGKKIEISDFNQGFDKLSEHYSPYLKEQIRTASSLKTELTWGTQFRKLLFASLFDNGKSTTKIKNLYKEYISILKDLSVEAKESLSKELGAYIDLETKKVIVTDYSKLVDRLKEQAILLDLPNNVKEALEYNPSTGELLNPFETTGASSQVLNMLFGMMDKKLRNWKAVGNQYIQVTNHTFDNLDFYDQVENSKKELKTTRAQCRITLTGEYRKLLNLTHKGKVLGNLENLNKALKDKAFRDKYKKELTIVGYRIPTANTNFMEYLEVVQFLPSQAGNIIQLYNEITAKSGADFDIDKLNIFLPTFNDNGTFMPYNKKEDLSKEAKDKLKQEKRDNVTEVNKILNSLRQELKDIRNLNEQELKSYKDRVAILQLEGGILHDLIESSLEEINFAEGNTSISNFIDSIMKNPLTLEDYKNQFDNELYTFFERSVEYETLLNEIEYNLASFNQIRQEVSEQIYEVKERALATYFNQTENYFNFLKRYNNKKGILTNKMLEIYSEVFQQPESFELLVKPNDASYVNSVFENMFDLMSKNPDIKINKSKGLPSKTDIFSYSVNLSLHERLKLSLKHLGIWATTNTNHSTATQNTLNLNPTFKETITDPDGKPTTITKRISLGLLSEEERKEVINKDGTINMGYNTDVEGRSIQSIFDMLIDVTVDAEKNPQYLYGNINDKNINLVIYLLRQRVPFKRAVEFISLEPIRKYFESKVLGELTFTPAIPNKYEKTSELDFSSFADQIVNPTDGNLLANAFYTMKALEKEASIFRDFTSHYTYDTEKINTPIATKTIEANLKKIKNADLVTQKSLDTWEKDTVISQFNNMSILKNLSQQVFPILFKEDLLNYFFKTLSSISNLNKSKRISLERMLSQEYIFSIYDNFGMYKDERFGDYANDLVSTSDLTNRFRDIGDKLSSEFVLFSQITSDSLVNTITGEEFHNFRLIRDINNKGSQINVLSEELETLLNYESGNEEFDEKVRNTIADFNVVAIKQGLSKSRFNMEDIVPLSFKQDIYFDAIDNYKQMISSNNEIPGVDNNLLHYYSKFENQFMNNYKNKFFPNLEVSNFADPRGNEQEIEQSELGNRVNNYTFNIWYQVMTEERKDIINKLLNKTSTKKEDINQKITLDKDSQLQKDLFKSGLEEDEYYIKNINNIPHVIVTKYTPKIVKKGYSKFYSNGSAYGNNFLLESYGKPFIVTGFEDVQLVIEQDTNGVIELTTGLSVRNNFDTQKEAKEKVLGIFTKNDIYDVLSKQKKLNVNNLEKTEEQTKIPPCAK